MMPANEMLAYVKSIRNSEKREYATRYAIWLLRAATSTVVEPSTVQLSYMAAQAVRMRLDAILRGGSSNE